MSDLKYFVRFISAVSREQHQNEISTRITHQVKAENMRRQRHVHMLVAAYDKQGYPRTHQNRHHYSRNNTSEMERGGYLRQGAIVTRRNIGAHTKNGKFVVIIFPKRYNDIVREWGP